MGRHIYSRYGELLCCAPGGLSSEEVSQYEFERRKYAQDLINFDKKFAALFSGKPPSKDGDEGVTHEEFLE